jgi:hypothetical protein
MVDSTGKPELAAPFVEASRRRTAILVGAFGASLATCLVLVEVVRRSRPVADAVPVLDQIRIALFVVAAVVVFASTVVKSFMLRQAPPDPALRLARVRSATILAAAMAELPALLGLVLFILGGSQNDFYILAVVSLYMLVRHFPRREPWDAYVQRGGPQAAR